MTKRRRKQQQAAIQAAEVLADQSPPNPGDFSRPHDADPVSVAFGAGDEVFRLMPPYADIPDEFKNFTNPFVVRIQSRWFFEGLEQWPLKPKSGVEMRKALTHIRAIQMSFTPPHEHKEAGVSYLMSLWFEAPKEG